MSKSLLFWALGSNGEGSARVIFAFVKHVFLTSSLDFSTITIVYSSDSTLDQLISLFLYEHKLVVPNPSIRFVKLPSFARNYLIHFFIKFFFPPFVFHSAMVFDDYPFRLLPRQVLYFHQANLLSGATFLWRLKRTALRLLLTPRLAIYFQTHCTRYSFCSKFGSYKALCFLHSIS